MLRLLSIRQERRDSYKVNWLVTVSYPGASFSTQAFGEAQGVIGKPKIAKRALRFSLSSLSALRSGVKNLRSAWVRERACNVARHVCQ